MKSPGWEGELSDEDRRAGRTKQPKYQQGHSEAFRENPCLAVFLGIASILFADVPVLGQRLDKIHRDESHFLTERDMRGDQDDRISCFCGDAIADA